MGAISQFVFFYTITKWSHKKNGLTASTLLANISQMELINKIIKLILSDFVRLGSKDFAWRFW